MTADEIKEPVSASDQKRLPASSSAAIDSPSIKGDIVQTYHSFLNSDPDLTMPIATIEALVAHLAHGNNPPVTAMELVAAVDRYTDDLLQCAMPSHSLPIRAGVELFRHYLLHSSLEDTDPARRPRDSLIYRVLSCRGHLRTHARAERAALAACGACLLTTAPSSSTTTTTGTTCTITTVLASPTSRAILALLQAAADQQTRTQGCPSFRVVFVTDEYGSQTTASAAATALRTHGVSVAVVGFAGAAHALQTTRAELVFAGADAITQNGGVVGHVGTLVLAQLARAHGACFHVAAELHKMVPDMPLDQADLARLGVRQEASVHFVGPDEHGANKEGEGEGESVPPSHAPSLPPVDYTPPNLITSIVTNRGIVPPSFVFDMFLEMSTS